MIRALAGRSDSPAIRYRSTFGRLSEADLFKLREDLAASIISP